MGKETTAIWVHFLKSIFAFFGIRVMLKRNSDILNSYIKNVEFKFATIKMEHQKFEIIDRVDKNYKKYFVNSHSQFSQDIFALAINGWKREGFFVEFGAFDGKTHSNTYMLEKDFGWNGIIAECSRGNEKVIRENRSCNVSSLAVWKESDRYLEFLDCELSELSTLKDYRDSDGHSAIREKGEVYLVKTITLNDLLKKYNAPRRIDFMSIDTEGSEWDILKYFDFSDYDISVITIEHNFNLNRNRVRDLLFEHGFKQVFRDIAEIEDWFVNVNIKNAHLYDLERLV